jgi:hypothetical protein
MDEEVAQLKDVARSYVSRISAAVSAEGRERCIAFAKCCVDFLQNHSLKLEKLYKNSAVGAALNIKVTLADVDHVSVGTKKISRRVYDQSTCRSANHHERRFHHAHFDTKRTDRRIERNGQRTVETFHVKALALASKVLYNLIILFNGSSSLELDS